MKLQEQAHVLAFNGLERATARKLYSLDDAQIKHCQVLFKD
jgi:hypothetical protein